MVLDPVDETTTRLIARVRAVPRTIPIRLLVYTVSERLIVRAEEFFDRDEALEAAGLRE